MTTIRPIVDVQYTFFNALSVLQALTDRLEIEPGTSSSFQGSEIGVPDATFDVTGRGFTYDRVGEVEVVSTGTIDGFVFSLSGGAILEFTNLGLRISKLQDAFEAGVSGEDPYASTDLILGLDYVYVGTGADERSLFDEGRDNFFDPAGDDLFILGSGRHDFRSGSGDDRLIGGPQSDRLDAGPGDDRIEGGRGSDTILGRSGQDTAVLDGLDGGGFGLIRGRGPNTVYALDRADRSHDQISGVESFTDGAQVVALSDVTFFDASAYAASHPDLAERFGTEERELIGHYLRAGFFEGREVTFDAEQYLANYADLRAAFGEDEAAATRHYIASGREAGRLAADPLDYIASFSDLSAAFGDLPTEAVRAAGLRHHQRSGAEEGRTGRIDFDADAYLANFPDLRAAFGDDEDAAALHYIRSGREAGRLAEDALTYLASFDDLVLAADARGLETEAQLRAFATTHFRRFGEAEGRDDRVDFDADAYLSNYGDLRDAFADGEGGYDEEAATVHWILNGFEAGRTADLLLVV
jgi:serralysin